MKTNALSPVFALIACVLVSFSASTFANELEQTDRESIKTRHVRVVGTPTIEKLVSVLANDARAKGFTPAHTANGFSYVGPRKTTATHPIWGTKKEVHSRISVKVVAKNKTQLVGTYVITFTSQDEAEIVHSVTTTLDYTISNENIAVSGSYNALLVDPGLAANYITKSTATTIQSTIVTVLTEGFSH